MHEIGIRTSERQRPSRHAPSLVYPCDHSTAASCMEQITSGTATSGCTATAPSSGGVNGAAVFLTSYELSLPHKIRYNSAVSGDVK